MFNILWDIIRGYIVNKQSVSSVVGSGVVVTTFVLGLQDEVKRVDNKINHSVASLSVKSEKVKQDVIRYVDVKNEKVVQQVVDIDKTLSNIAVVVNRIDDKVKIIEERQYNQITK